MGKQEIDLGYDHLASWKLDDKNWMKQRRLSWKNIQIQLDRMRTADSNMFGHLPKKNYKYLKNYYLTGRDKLETKKWEDLVNCLTGYDSQYEADVLLQFWLSADHSEKYLIFLKQYLEQEFDKRRPSYTTEDWEKEKVKRSWIYEKSNKAYRHTISFYNGTEKYKWEGETNEYNGPIFGDLEPEMLSLFPLTPKQIKDSDKHLKGNGGTGLYTYTFENVLAGYFGSKQKKQFACFNPHNPIRFLLDEYERWGIPEERRDTQGRRPFLISTALTWYVVDTPEGRHPIQVEVAQELKQRILDIRKSAPNETRERIGNAIKIYETGKFQQYL